MTHSHQRSRRAKKIPCGIEALDSILHGGLNRRRIYLIEGLPGTGKTTLAMQFLLEGARAGERVAYITLSRSSEELLESAESHGWSLENIQLYEMSQIEDQLREESQQTFYHPSDVELAESVQPILQMLEREKPHRLVFDSVSEIRLLAGAPLRYRRQMLLLKQLFARQGCTVLLLDDFVGCGGDVQLESIVDGVIRLERLTVQYGVERRRLSIVKMRGSTFRGGFHDFRIETGGLRVFPRLVASEHAAEFVPAVISSGIPELDELLGGGVQRGSSLLVIGPVGVGKSTLLIQFAIAAAQRGEKSLVLLFDETCKQRLDRADALHVKIRKHVKNGTIGIRQVDPGELSPGELAGMLREAVEREGVTQVQIDGLDGYLRAMPEDRFPLLQLQEMMTYLSQHGTVTHLVQAQRGMLGEGRIRGMDASGLADTIIVLRYFESNGKIRRAMGVIKKRGGPHEGTLRQFTIAAERIRFGPPLHQFQGVLTGPPIYLDGQEYFAEDQDANVGAQS